MSNSNKVNISIAAAYNVAQHEVKFWREQCLMIEQARVDLAQAVGELQAEIERLKGVPNGDHT